MRNLLTKENILRTMFYILGMLVLAAGITLNTKTGLGVSPIISVPFAISEIWTLNFGMATFAIYLIFVVLQFILKGKKRTAMDLLQIPVCFAFSILLNVFSDWLDISLQSTWQNVILLVVAFILTGIGAAMSVNVKMIPNPGDGIAKTVADVFNKDMGFGKNVVDITCVAITCIVSFLTVGSLVGFGIGTVAAMILVGRIIAIFNHFFKGRMEKVSGVTHKVAEMES